VHDEKLISHTARSADLRSQKSWKRPLSFAQRNDGVGAGNGPVHAGAFQACADSHSVSSFDHAGGSTQAPSVELRAAHALAVSLEIVQAAARVLGAGYLAADGHDDKCLARAGASSGSSRAGLGFILTLLAPVPKRAAAISLDIDLLL